MQKYVLPATLLRRGYNTVKERTMKAVYPATGTAATRRDVIQYQEGKILSWSAGYTVTYSYTPIYGYSQVGS